VGNSEDIASWLYRWDLRETFFSLLTFLPTCYPSHHHTEILLFQRNAVFANGGRSRWQQPIRPAVSLTEKQKLDQINIFNKGYKHE